MSMSVIINKVLVACVQVNEGSDYQRKIACFLTMLIAECNKWTMQQRHLKSGFIDLRIFKYELIHLQLVEKILCSTH